MMEKNLLEYMCYTANQESPYLVECKGSLQFLKSSPLRLYFEPM